MWFIEFWILLNCSLKLMQAGCRRDDSSVIALQDTSQHPYRGQMCASTVPRPWKKSTFIRIISDQMFHPFKKNIPSSDFFAGIGKTATLTAL